MFVVTRLQRISDATGHEGVVVLAGTICTNTELKLGRAATRWRGQRRVAAEDRRAADAHRHAAADQEKGVQDMWETGSGAGRRGDGVAAVRRWWRRVRTETVRCREGYGRRRTGRRWPMGLPAGAVASEQAAQDCMASAISFLFSR
jgi:hypothetical protein